MTREKESKDSDQAGIVMASMGSRLQSINTLDDLWNKFTLAELQMLTSLSEEEIRARLPQIADKILSLAGETQSADLSANKVARCCWRICCWKISAKEE